MFSPNIDLGQTIIASLIAIVGWFVKKEIAVIAKRLDKHEDLIYKLTSSIQRVIGFVQARDNFFKD